MNHRSEENDPARKTSDAAAEQAWNNSPAIRSEFLSIEDFKAFKFAEARGNFRVLAAQPGLIRASGSDMKGDA